MGESGKTPYCVGDMQFPGNLVASGMKASDADLIEKLNALPEDQRAELLELLTGQTLKGPHGAQLLDLLEASISLHKKTRNQQNS